MRLSEANNIAQAFVELMAPHSDKIEVGGSVRRGRPVVKDIEIVCLPKYTNPATRSSSWCMALFTKTTILKGKNGHKNKGGLNTARYIQLRYKGAIIDLFMATEDNYGWIKLIRTGDRDFSMLMVMKLKERGIVSKEGYLYDSKNGTLQVVPTEEEVFELAGMDYIAPEKRTGSLYKNHISHGNY